MADAKYIGIAGFIQFDVKERDVGERKVRDIVVRPVNSMTGQNFYVTLWPDFKDVALEKGDFVAIEGKYSKVDKDTEDGPRTYHNLSCQRITVGIEVKNAPKPDTVNASSSSDDDEPF